MWRTSIVIAVALAFASLGTMVTACGGQSAGNGDVCYHAAPPPVVTEARVLRLDNIDMGETRDAVNTSSSSTSIPRARSYGYDLDGLCTDGTKPESLECRPVAGAIRSAVTDGDAGIDNSFGKHLLTLLETGFTKPSAAMSGFSYLETQSDGHGTLYLGTSDHGILFVIPLVDVRLEKPAGDELGMLAAIAPRDALAASVREHINLSYGATVCNTPTADSLVQTVLQAADIRVAGAPSPDADCDGISIAMRISGTSVPAVPPVATGCPAPN